MCWIAAKTLMTRFGTLFVFIFLLFAASACARSLSTESNEPAIRSSEQSNTRLAVLLYHQLVDGEPKSGAELKVDDFAAQMKYLYDNGYKALSIKDFLSYYSSGQFPERSVMITFDDGYESVYTKAYPILARYQLKALVFPVVGATPGLVRETTWNSHLSFQQMRLMDKNIIEIGSHSYNLHYYRDEKRPAVMPEKGEREQEYEERIRQDLRASKDILELQTDRKVVALAWPYGKTTHKATEIALELGYQLMFTIRPEVVTTSTPLTDIPRFSIVDGSLDSFRKLLKQLE